MHPAETYRRRAERAERDFENARDPKAKRFAQVAAQRWRELAELAQRQETEGPPIPVRFRDASEAAQYAQDHKFVLYCPNFAGADFTKNLTLSLSGVR